MRIVSKFAKEENVKFISHLDMMRTFQRAIRRAYLPISFTQGFNPHPKMAFASALSVGVTSEGEYIDLTLKNDVAVEEFNKRLNDVLPLGLKILRSAEMPMNAPTLMSIIDKALYRFYFQKSKDDFGKQIQEFFRQNVILVSNEKKGTLNHTNIRPLMELVNIDESHSNFDKVDVLLNSGSKSNLKPTLVLSAMIDFLQADIEALNSKIHRLELFLIREEQLMTPIDLALHLYGRQ